MVVIGLDPGLKGGIAVIDGNEVILVYRMPLLEGDYDIIRIHQLLTDAFSYSGGDMIIAIENVHAMPIFNPKTGRRQGITSMFSFGRGKGILEAISLCVLQDDKHLVKVTPQAWKKKFGLIKQPKRASIEVAKKEFPELADRKLTHGEADALLVAGFVELCAGEPCHTRTFSPGA